MMVYFGLGYCENAKKPATLDSSLDPYKNIISCFTILENNMLINLYIKEFKKPVQILIPYSYRTHLIKFSPVTMASKKNGLKKLVA